MSTSMTAWIKSVKSEKEAIQLANQLRELLAKGGFRLTKWVSNSREVINSFPESERAASAKDLDLESLPVERVQWVQWNISSDQFGFKIAIKERPATRRGILSVVSSVCDPLGFAAPFIFQAKLILQELCRKKLGWDDEIPADDQERWQTWLKELPKLEELTIERCFKPTNFSKIKSSQLHHFSDTSQQGYGAVTYLRIDDDTGKVHSSFMMERLALFMMERQLTSHTFDRQHMCIAIHWERSQKIPDLCCELDRNNTRCILIHRANGDTLILNSTQLMKYHAKESRPIPFSVGYMVQVFLCSHAKRDHRGLWICATSPMTTRKLRNQLKCMRIR